MTFAMPRLLDEKLPDTAHEALRIGFHQAIDNLTAQSVSMDDFRLALQTLSKLVNDLARLASDYLAALNASLADRRQLRADLDAAIATLTAVQATITSLQNSLAGEVTRATMAEAAISARISALEARALYGTTGQLTKNLTLGVGGTTTTYGITFAKAMPSADYIPLVTLDSSSVSLLGTTSVVYPITNKTAFGCTVTVRNTAVLTVASSVTVQVAALQLT